jgi:hypothetical protein
MNEENGYVLIQLENKDKDGNEISISKGGYFTLSRASNEDNYETWFQLDDFVIYNNDLPSTCYWKDCTV